MQLRVQVSKLLISRIPLHALIVSLMLHLTIVGVRTKYKPARDGSRAEADVSKESTQARVVRSERLRADL